MNYYERIHKSIDFIEEHLCEEIPLQMCADEAYMSLSGYYRMFLSISGYTVKEYIRLRRLTCALEELCTNPHQTVLDTAIKYDYNSADGFTRSFKNQFGILPSQVKNNNSQHKIVKFERLDLMEKLLENEDKELFDRYPDIKVIRNLEDMKVACFTYYGEEPENHAFMEIKQWFIKNEIDLYDSAYRLFGYNHPDPEEGATIYGYEFCIIIPEKLYDKLEDVPVNMVNQTYPKVYRKVLRGGKYAVMSVKRGKDGDIGNNIIAAWKRFMKWMDESKYIWGRN
ncbi:MAG: AraC family transcriptional regulator [Clostridiales bacterium]|nr:AraC family transcriptional regulator [Clostridiales bacterium]